MTSVSTVTASSVRTSTLESSASMQKHRELDAIWHELRPDADARVPWERYAAWAEAHDEAVRIVRITCGPAERRAGGAPSPYSRRVVKRLDPDDIAAAAAEMERLRDDAATRELEARTRQLERLSTAARLEEERATTELGRATADQIALREEAMRREMREQETAERRAQA